MIHEVKFSSYNQRDEVYGWIYVPAAKIRGVVQLVHGFGEHSRRYLHMICKFMDAGFVVAADDHVGHGKTALENDTWGNWGSKGCQTMMEDEHILKQIVQEKYPDVPYFMFGHSMGSIICRQFLAKYGDELAGAMGGLFARIEEGVKIGNEWICHDPYVQIDHATDPFDAFTKPTSNEALLQFVEMIDEVNTPEWAGKVPNIPLYNVAGAEDPCGSYGEGVKLVTKWLEDTGHDVTTVLYEGYRHEIHNYADLKDKMEAGLVDFLNGILEK